MSSRRYMVTGLVLAALLPLLAAALEATARKSRAVPGSDGKTRVVTVADAKELRQAYRSLGLRGRLLLHLGRHLHFEPVPVTDLYTLDQGTVREIMLADAYAKKVNYRNYLWTASREGTFRGTRYLLPEDDFREKAGDAGVSGQDEFSTYDSGYLRIIARRIPGRAAERPVVHIDATWLESSTPQDVVSLLRKLPRYPDVITLSRAEDDPDCTPSAREQLSRLTELLLDSHR